jgi:hypothetical protein
MVRGVGVCEYPGRERGLSIDTVRSTPDDVTGFDPPPLLAYLVGWQRPKRKNPSSLTW